VNDPYTHDSDDGYRDHQRRIAAIVDDWRRGLLSVTRKREAIAAENLRYYGGPHKSPNTGEPLGSAPRRGDTSISVLTESSGIMFEAVSAALTAARKANARAAEADTLAEACELIESGRESARAILAAARPGRVPERAAPPPPPDETQGALDW
jgi:cytochrome c1